MAFFWMGKTLYILKSQKHGRFYIGSTNNLERRIDEHHSGQTKSTKTGIPWSLVFTADFQTSIEGLKAEQRIKALKSRKIIEGLINRTILISELLRM